MLSCSVIDLHNVGIVVQLLIKLNLKQESFPVGCVTSAAVAVGGCLPRGVCLWGVCSGVVYPGGVCPGGCLPEGCVCPGGVCPENGGVCPGGVYSGDVCSGGVSA